jgi:hypothetical protein
VRLEEDRGGPTREETHAAPPELAPERVGGGGEPPEQQAQRGLGQARAGELRERRARASTRCPRVAVGRRRAVRIGESHGLLELSGDLGAGALEAVLLEVVDAVDHVEDGLPLDRARAARAAPDHLHVERAAERRPRQQNRPRVGDVRPLGEDPDVDEDLRRPALEVDQRPSSALRRVAAVERVGRHPVALERPGELLRVLDVARERDGLPELLRARAPVRDDLRVALLVPREGAEDGGAEVSLALVDPHVRLRQAHRLRREHPLPEEHRPREEARLQQVAEGAVERRLPQRLLQRARLGRVLAVGRGGEAEERPLPLQEPLDRLPRALGDEAVGLVVHDDGERVVAVERGEHGLVAHEGH